MIRLLPRYYALVVMLLSFSLILDARLFKHRCLRCCFHVDDAARHDFAYADVIIHFFFFSPLRYGAILRRRHGSVRVKIQMCA